jgi:hypothetical protein
MLGESRFGLPNSASKMLHDISRRTGLAYKQISRKTANSDTLIINTLLFNHNISTWKYILHKMSTKCLQNTLKIVLSEVIQ